MVGSVIIVGAFPPPIGGAAKNNQNLLNELKENQVATIPVNIAAETLSHTRSLSFHAQRIRKNISAFIEIFRNGNRLNTMYIVPDGGLGAWYSLAHIAIARISKYKNIVIHHRTFLYIDRVSLPVSLFTRITRNFSMHVFLSEGMAGKFEAKYGHVKFSIAGNARYVAVEAAREASPRQSGPIRVGYLSNICAEKGYYTASDTFRALSCQLSDAELWIAGPILEQEAYDDIENLKTSFPDRIKYFGALYGEEKYKFYRDLDIFLFPTQFSQEAAPNVIYEALASGTPVLSTERGCIPEMVSSSRGKTFTGPSDFVDGASRWIADNVKVLLDASTSARIKESTSKEAQLAEAQHKALLQIITGS